MEVRKHEDRRVKQRSGRAIVKQLNHPHSQDLGPGDSLPVGEYPRKGDIPPFRRQADKKGASAQKRGRAAIGDTDELLRLLGRRSGGLLSDRLLSKRLATAGTLRAT